MSWPSGKKGWSSKNEVGLYIGENIGRHRGKKTGRIPGKKELGSSQKELAFR
jgi:hypothetical protein